VSGFGNRVGILAYALTPLTVALSTRESIITLVTGIPYQSLNFLHRWLGRIIFIQSFLHTLVWTVIEGKLYQPQPSLYMVFMNNTYIVWGVIAMALVTFLYVFSLQRVVKWTGHEFFRKTHYVVAAVYFGACWAHWSHLACWMIASLGVWGLDRGIRFLRTGLIHVGYLNSTKGKSHYHKILTTLLTCLDFGFHSSQATVKYFDDEDGGVIRLEFNQNMEAWAVGQHFFLCFPALTIWQSHPLTVASVPEPHPACLQHTYIIRCRKGETGRLKTLALSESTDSSIKEPDTPITTPVILTGPYGTPLLPYLPNTGPEITNMLAIAGGTGISLTLPVILAATSTPIFANAAIDFIWIVRRSTNVQWISQELDELKSCAQLTGWNLRMHIYITQEKEASASETNSLHDEAGEKGEAGESITPIAEGCCSSDTSTEKSGTGVCCSANTGSSGKGKQCREFCTTYMNSCHPSLDDIVSSFVENRAHSSHRTRVIASGPAGMGHDLRAAVAKVNDGGKVWRGDMRWDVDLHVCKFPEHFFPLIVHFTSLDTPIGCLSAPETFKRSIETRESRGNYLIK